MWHTEWNETLPVRYTVPSLYEVKEVFFRNSETENIS